MRWWHLCELAPDVVDCGTDYELIAGVVREGIEKGKRRRWARRGREPKKMRMRG
jgi:hypothetical protein